MYWIALRAQPEASAAVEAARGNPAGASELSDAATALGWWALQFTPKVVRIGQAVLMEVSASERLFGGRQALLKHIFRSSPPVQPVQTARASTGLQALARLHTGRNAPHRPDQLPLDALPEALPHLETLYRLGCRCWGDVRALPRDGVARRFGAGLLEALDRAYGLAPESYLWLKLPEVFDQRLELATQVEDAPALLFAAGRLLAQLLVWLQARTRGVVAFEFAWQMDVRRRTEDWGRLVIRTAEPTRDMRHLQRLLGEHLAHARLAAPALYLRMRSVETGILTGASSSLLPDTVKTGDSLHQLLERLSARLGAGQVLRALSDADHRPERMQRWVEAVHGRPASDKTARGGARKLVAAQAIARQDPALYPGWLLPVPLALEVQRGCPVYYGPLTLLMGPQRLEAGWWDMAHPSGRDARNPAVEGPVPPGEPFALRDYFVASSAQAGLLWIYRERLAAKAKAPERVSSPWFLHGLFG